MLSYPWSGAMFSDRLWQNKQALIYNVREILTQGVIQGKSIDAMTQTLAGKLGRSYKAAERLIRTETNYIHNESSKTAYRAAGVEQYEYMASLNERTCEICGELDGKVFSVEDAIAGTNYPPIHPNCRCTTVEYDAEDIADRIASGEPMTPQLHYAEWKQKQIEAWEVREQQMQEAEPIYKEMQEKGLMRLPELDKFAEMRYNTSPAYQKLLARYQNLTGERPWSAVEFNPETLASHFQDHGKDFAAASDQEYADMALAFINGSESKESFMDSEGTRRFFSEESGIFASAYPDGTIRTFFKPKKGKKYWDGQVKKYGSEEQN